mmetsp:Transcript_15363/g.33629  ORF Transcript_15363/g.33629 Transcript_15363/m.33629 type:complete len:85 (+) Transcript_15363:1764-2018(+)
MLNGISKFEDQPLSSDSQPKLNARKKDRLWDGQHLELSDPVEKSISNLNSKSKEDDLMVMKSSHEDLIDKVLQVEEEILSEHKV